MNRNSVSAIDLYLNKAFKILLIIIPLTAVSAGVTLTAVKILGFYDEVSWIALLIFDLTCVLYAATGIVISVRCEDSTGRLKPDMFRYGKIFFAVVAFVQWNFLSYMVSSRNIWAYAVFFVMLSIFLLNRRYVFVIASIVFSSQIVSWFIRGDVLLPARDEYFIPEVVLRLVFMFLGCTTAWLITYFIGKFLIPELERVAEYDSLTQLLNRNALEGVASKMINKSFRSGEPFTLLMCDLDDFKNINDTYGHDCGDDVLKYVADTIVKNLGEYDTAFRYGGEELIVLIDADERTALDRAEIIRRDIESGAVSNEGDLVSVTITIGAIAYKRYDTLDGMIKGADERLYYGKRNGKNQVVSKLPD